MKFGIRTTLCAGVLMSGMALSCLSALAQEVTLKVHHFLPPQATTHAKVLVPWKEAVESQSGGRIKLFIGLLAKGGEVQFLQSPVAFIAFAGQPASGVE